MSSQIESQLAEIRAAISRLDECVRGNGKPGLVTRVTLIESVQARSSRLAWILVTAATGAAASSITAAVVTMIHASPTK